MSRTSKNDHAATRTLPLVLPMPRASYWTAAAPHPWVAVDPVFGAQCIALYRSIRLTLLALIAFLSGPRTLRAGQTKPAQEIGSSATCAPQDANVPATARRAVRRARPGCFIRRTELNISVRVSLASDLPARDTPELTMQRTHAPPALQTQIAFCFSYHDLPPPGTVLSTSPEVTSPKQNSPQFIVKRTHAPPAHLYTILRSKNCTKRFHRFAPLQILAALAQRSLPGSRVLAGASTSAVDSPELKQPHLRNQRAHAPPVGGVQDRFALVSLRIPRAAGSSSVSLQGRLKTVREICANGSATIDPHLPHPPASPQAPEHFVHPSWFAAAIADRSPGHFPNMHVHTGLAWSLPGEPIPAPGDNDYVRF